MLKKIIISSFLLMWFYTISFANQQKKYNEVFLLMGSRFEIAVISNNETEAQKGIQLAHDEIVRIEKLISSWDEHSETSLINKNAGNQPVKVSDELLQLIKRANKVSKLTNGAFDISFAVTTNFWKFDGSESRLPLDSIVKASINKINYKNIQINDENSTVFLKEKGMKIGFGAIGKGFAANKAKQLLIKNGFQQGMINAGGDLIVWGEGINGIDWKIGIADPNKAKGYISWLTVKDLAVVTSGDYERFTMINGERYAHIINPKTGYPVKGIKSVTIICPDAELADALATSVFVLGIKKGMELINQLNAIECVIIDDKNKMITSKNIDKILGDF